MAATAGAKTATQAQASVSTTNDTEATCPECRINHVEAPFDYCSMCEMLTLYYREKLASAEHLRNQTQLTEAYEKWRSLLTWTEIEHLRDVYWTKAKRVQMRAGY